MDLEQCYFKWCCFYQSTIANCLTIHQFLFFILILATFLCGNISISAIFLLVQFIFWIQFKSLHNNFTKLSKTFQKIYCSWCSYHIRTIIYSASTISSDEDSIATYDSYNNFMYKSIYVYMHIKIKWSWFYYGKKKSCF